jgi:hypothetical protein
MTIAAGFHVHGGLVMCADSQELQGDYKFPVQKLLLYTDAFTNIGIAGSGIGPLVDMAAQQVASAAMGGYEHTGIIKQRIQETLLSLYQNEFSVYPCSEPDDTLVELLIGVKLSSETPRLFHTCGPTLSEVNEYAVIGSGRVVEYQVQTLYDRQMSVSKGVLVAVQLLNIAKSVLSSVGGRGKIITIHDGDKGIGEASWYEIKELESALQRFSYESGKLLLDFPDFDLDDQQFVARLRSFTDLIETLRDEYRLGAKTWAALLKQLNNPPKKT